MTKALSFAFLIFAALSCGSGAKPGGPKVLRVGHFPNVTHAHGLVAHALTRAQKGWFEERLGPGVEVQWFTYSAGPSAIEALLTGALDLTYVGPSPALNAYAKSGGQEIRVIAGATLGGSALLVQGDGPLHEGADFRGKKIATPQLGNTQDVAARAWLEEHGVHVTQTGGDAQVIPTQNSDQLDLFVRHELDAVWTVEPWVSRLELEAGARILVQENDALTTVLVTSPKFLRDEPELARRFAAAHAELGRWIGEHADEAKRLVRAELEAETTRPMKAELLERCWPRMRFTSEISLASFQSFVGAAQKAGFLKDAGDLSHLIEELH